MTTRDILDLCKRLRERHGGEHRLEAVAALQRQAAEIERLRGALGNATAALASISGLAQLATKAAIENLQARATLTGEDTISV